MATLAYLPPATAEHNTVHLDSGTPFGKAILEAEELQRLFTWSNSIEIVQPKTIFLQLFTREARPWTRRLWHAIPFYNEDAPKDLTASSLQQRIYNALFLKLEEEKENCPPDLLFGTVTLSFEFNLASAHYQRKNVVRETIPLYFDFTSTPLWDRLWTTLDSACHAIVTQFNVLGDVYYEIMFP